MYVCVCVCVCEVIICGTLFGHDVARKQVIGGSIAVIIGSSSHRFIVEQDAFDACAAQRQFGRRGAQVAAWANIGRQPLTPAGRGVGTRFFV